MLCLLPRHRSFPPPPLLLVRLACVVAFLWCGRFPAQAQGMGRARLAVPAPRAHYGPGYYYPVGPAVLPTGPVVPPVLLPPPLLPPAPTPRDGTRSRGLFRRRG